MTVTTFDAGGRALSYVRRGHGAPVVCVPGGPGFDPVAYFAGLEMPGRELIVVAPRGTGASTPPPTPDGYRIAGYADDLESLRLHLGVEALTIYGSSHGGSVALAYAAAHPGHVERLVLDGVPALWDEAFRAEVAEARRRFTETFTDGAQRLAASDAAGAEMPRTAPEERRRGLLRTVLSRHVARLGAAQVAYLDGICSAPLNWQAPGVMFAEFDDGLDLLTPAAGVAVPTLVVAGQYDVVIPAAASRRLAATMPSGTYLEITDAGHFAEVESGDAFSASVGDFIAAGDEIDRPPIG